MITIVYGIIATFVLAFIITSLIVNRKELFPKRSPQVVTSLKDDVLETIKNDPEGFFNLIKEYLPRDKGVFYSVEAEKYTEETRTIGADRQNWILGDDLIRVVIFDGVTENKVGTRRYNESFYRKGRVACNLAKLQQLVTDDTAEEILKSRRQALNGRKEIVF